MLFHRCSYCQEEIAPPEETHDNSEQVSHGVCRSCLEKIMAGSGQPFAEFLDSLQQPVFVVDQNVRIKSANVAGQKIVKKNLEEIQDRLGGEVFECAEALLPGGCGNRQLCRCCVIRNAVMETYQDGQPRIKIPAYHELDLITGHQKVKFLISTEKVEDMIFLQIEEMSFE